MVKSYLLWSNRLSCGQSWSYRIYGGHIVSPVVTRLYCGHSYLLRSLVSTAVTRLYCGQSLSPAANRIGQSYLCGPSYSTPPNVQTGTINYGTGVLVLTTDETIDVTPYGTQVDLTVFFINQIAGSTTADNVNTGDSTGTYVSTGVGSATVVEQDGQSITLHLTELARVGALLTSGTPGGDGGANHLDIGSGGLLDIGLNPSVVAQLVLQELPDALPPVLLSGRVNLSTGVLVVVGNEILDVRVPMNTSGMYVGDVSGDMYLNLQGCAIHVQEARDFSYDFTVTLTEKQRVALIAVSNTPGGDHEPSVLDVYARTITDMAGNTNQPSLNLIMNETEDSVPPRLTSATIHYGLGVVALGFSETINYTSLNLQHALLMDHNGGTGASLPLTDCTILPQAQAPQYYNDTINAPSRHYVVFVLDELTRSLAIALSNTNGGDSSTLTVALSSLFITDMARNHLVAVPAYDLVETPDLLQPVVTFGVLNYSTGLLRITTNETIDVTASATTMDLNGFTLHNDASTAVVGLQGASVRDVDDVSFDITLTEEQRALAIALSNVPGGDGSPVRMSIATGAFVDVAQNDNVAVVGMPLSEGKNDDDDS